MASKIPDAVKLAALVMCSTTKDCVWCPIRNADPVECNDDDRDTAQRILAAWRKGKPAKGKGR